MVMTFATGEVRGERLDLVGGARKQREAVAGLGESAGDDRAELAGRAGDDDDALGHRPSADWAPAATATAVAEPRRRAEGTTGRRAGLDEGVPTPRSGLAAAVLDGRIHVLGGESPDPPAIFDEHEVFDPLAGAWTPAPLLPRGATASGRSWSTVGSTTIGGGPRPDLSASDRVDVFVPSGG
jgi:hypothetical protein